MKTVIRTAMLCLVITLTTQISSFASGEYVTPFFFNHARLVKSIVANPSAFDVSGMSNVASAKHAAKVCSCQILRVRSNNESLSDVAMFSEKINNGDVSSDLKIAATMLSAERKNFKMQFFNEVKVSRKVTAMTDCQTMIAQLKAENTELKVYDVIDADARMQVAHK